MMTFKITPGNMIIELVNYTVMWPKMFLPNSGISSTIIPRVIITGIHLNLSKYCTITFGVYVHTYKD